jgi:hypothetical protein
MTDRPVAEAPSSSVEATEPRAFSLYGITLESDYPFSTPLPGSRSGSEPDLRFSRVWQRPDVTDWSSSKPLFRSVYLTEDGEPEVCLYAHSDFEVLRHTGVADYYVWPERIVCHQLEPREDVLIELYFLGLVLGFWLERRGTRVLHGSSVALDERGAVVFLATNTGGKTSLAASLMLAGGELLSDDLLAIDLAADTPAGYPAFPQMRMWPDLRRHFLPDHEGLPTVLPDIDKVRVPVGAGGLGSFCRQPRPIEAIYLPERRDADAVGSVVERQPVSPRDALIELVRESFLSRILEEVGIHRERFPDLSLLAARVPMFRLSYPSGLDLLPLVRSQILEWHRGLE